MRTDIRTKGSGNSGTTNALRVLGPKAGVLVFLGDFGKAFLLCMLIRLYFGARMPEETLMLMLYGGFGVILGHNYPHLPALRPGLCAADRRYALRLARLPGRGSRAFCPLAFVGTRPDACAVPCLLRRSHGRHGLHRRPCLLAAPGQHRPSASRKRKQARRPPGKGGVTPKGRAAMPGKHGR